ncbi:MAG: hypothetical protein COX16_01215 [Deltaproteobacteria bacterium CG23_combo_of_CG06-09_8_20_14_all_51_20]|nr:MAG: hypothetical protein AUK28_05720 [Desulfobacterales bacterium CG2_30_60_27]PIP48370.1 MAG: hypothetical protein COX16_01215 [Deltaproteobacteria bacterium CG23_combo_of_CG06-09_8_20_14_all_51_20]
MTRHQALHRDLLTESTRILWEIKAGKQVTALQLIDFFKHWLVDHILAEDQQLAAPNANEDREGHGRPAGGKSGPGRAGKVGGKSVGRFDKRGRT